MELFIHIWTNLEYFKLLNEWFLLSCWKQDKDIAWFFMQNFPWELAENISPQYEINFVAIRELKKKFWWDVFNKISWIYYWSDNCEYLVWLENEVKTAYENFLEFNKNFPPHKSRVFSFVTPYVWDIMMEKLKKSLNYLNQINSKTQIEVIVNDFGVLRYINNNCKNLKVVFWRLIHKILKTPLIDTFWYDVHPDWELIKNKSAQEIDKLKDIIKTWQLKFYNSSEVSLDIYKNFLQKNSVSRVALDYMEKRQDLFKNRENIWIDLYYPWALVFTWRLCDTSSVENPARGYYAVDEICPRTCNRIDVSYKIKTIWYNLIQRWNSAYRSEINLDYLDDDFIKNNSNRLVFAPFITV